MRRGDHQYGMKKLLKEILYAGKKILPSRGVSVLMYHSVGDNKEFFTVSPGVFEREIKYLTDHNYRIIPLSQLVASLKEHAPIPTHTVVLTFDDGYADNYSEVFPVLRRYHVPASIFISTSFVGGTRTVRRGTLPMLSWEQIREMKDSGLIEFFPHTHTHPKLTNISSAEAEREIRESRDILQKQLGVSADLFAYPYGFFNAEIISQVKNAGFRGACTVQSGIVTARTDSLLIPRNSIDSHVTFSMFKGIIQRGRIR